MGRHDLDSDLSQPLLAADDQAAPTVPDVRPMIDRPRHYWRQVDRAVMFLATELATADLVQRAMHILRAKPGAPLLEREHGYRANPKMIGKRVKCRSCKRRFAATPEDPYLNATTQANGICTTCVIMPKTDDQPGGTDDAASDPTGSNDELAKQDDTATGDDSG